MSAELFRFGGDGMTPTLNAAGALTVLTLLVLAVTACSQPRGAREQLVVHLDSGSVAGQRTGQVAAFKGIAFAAAPVGDFRWRAPQPVAHWQGLRSATEYGPACPQPAQGLWPVDFDPAIQSEDCLYLNVWMPLRQPKKPYPVMVWIHGGGWTNGSSSAPLYDGQVLASAGVVMVSINYRLGALGFLAHPGLSAENEHAISGNYGILDQVAALQWVRRNISAFGGNPENVTVFGQSSGSMAVTTLMSSPLAEGLFHRAIGQSGSLFLPLSASPIGSEYVLKGAEDAGARLTAHLGLDPTALRARPAADFVSLPGYSSHPVIDGRVLEDEPHNVFVGGSQNDVPLLLGTTSQEGVHFIKGPLPTAADFQDDLSKAFGPVGIQLAPIYRPATDEEAFASRVELEGDLRFVWETRKWGLLQARTGRQPVYVYRFDHRSRADSSPDAATFAAHGDEMRYVFGHRGSGWTARDEALASLMQQYWVRFARTGNPNSGDLPDWPRYDPANEMALVIEEGGASAHRIDVSKLQKLDGIFESLRSN